jgi:hypothetical protein
MLTKAMEVLFGCWHGNYSFPMTLKPGRWWSGGSISGTYVVCLDCGREMPYDWAQMRLAVRRAKQAGAEVHGKRSPVATGPSGSLAKAR